MKETESNVGILDLGISNIASITNAIKRAGHIPKVIAGESEIRGCSHLILPGVGSFLQAARKMRENALDQAIRRHVESGRALLGICLGMQILAEAGEEHGLSQGLGLIEGTVSRIDTSKSDLRLPHVGWNDIQVRKRSPLLEGVGDGESFYFVHSYAYSDPDSAMVVATTQYGGPQVAVVQSGPVFGVQFHPEKSQVAGAKVLSNFLSLEL
jgi:glutamine amidotransferase